MAQYRAIFKNAYFKGLATAAVVTMGLAVGQAQAANFEGKAPVDGEIIIKTSATAANEFDAFKITKIETGETFANNDVKISTGQTSDNFIKSADTTATSFKAKSLTIDMGSAGNATHGLSIEAVDEAATGTFNTVTVTKGTISISGTAANVAKLDAGTINLGKEGTIKVAGGTANSELGTAKTSYNLESGSTIEIGASGAVLGNISNSSGGTIHFTDAGTLQAFGTGADLNITVDATKTGTIALADDDTDTSANESLLSLSKGTIQVAGGATAGKLAITQGTVSLGENVVLAATTNDSDKAGTIQVGDASTSGKLEIAKKATLQNFLSGQNLPSTIKTPKKGALDIAKSGSVVVNDDIKLSDFTYSSTAGTAGSINAAADGAKIVANNITAATAATTASNLTFVAKDKLTIGAAGTGITSDTVGPKFEAKNVEFVAKGQGNPFVLKDKVTLSSTETVKVESVDTIKTTAGEIKGEVVLANATKGLIINGGTYSTNAAVTLSGGELSVTNSIGSSKADKSTLTLTNDLVLNRQATGNKITVDGSGTELDLTQANIKYSEDKTNKIAIKADNGGVIKLQGGDNLQSIFVADASGAVFTLDNGSNLDVTGNLTLKGAQLTKTDITDAKAGIVTTKGTVKVSDTLTVTDIADTGLDIGDSGSVLADKVALNVTNKTTAPAKLASGSITVLGGLSTDSDKGIEINGANSKLNLGLVETDTKTGISTALSTGGSIDNDVLFSGSKGLVDSGVWNAKNVTVSGTGAELLVGQKTSLFDAQDQAITATLKVNGKLTTAQTNALKIKKDGIVEANQFVSSAESGASVEGKLLIVGKTTEAEQPDGSKKITDYGVGLGTAKGVYVARDGVLTLGEVATQSIKLTETSGIVTAVANQDGVTSFVAGTSGALETALGGTVELTFADTVKFDEAGLESLRGLLFGTDGTQHKGFLNIGKAGISAINVSSGSIAWDELSKFDDIANITNDELKNAQVTGIEAGDEIRANVGSLSSETLGSGDKITILDNTVLNNAAGNKVEGYFAAGNNDALLGLDVKNGMLTLNNGGQLGATTLGANTVLSVNGGSQATETKITSISGDNTTEAAVNSGKLVLDKASSVGTLNTKNNTELVVSSGNLTLSSTTEKSEVNGNLTISSGDLVISGDVALNGQTAITGNLNASATNAVLNIANNFTTVTGNAQVKNGSITNNGALVVGGTLSLASSGKLVVGSEGNEATGEKSSAGYLYANKMTLNSGTLLIDPAYERDTSVAVISKFNDSRSAGTIDTNAGYANGNLVVGQNSALFVGTESSEQAILEVEQFLSNFQKNGALDADKYGSLAYVQQKLTVAPGAQVIVDSVAKASDFAAGVPTKYTAVEYNGASYNPSLYLGEKTALVVNDQVLDQNNGGVAVHFDKANASIYADASSRVLLDGAAFSEGNRTLQLFTDNGTDRTPGPTADTNGVKIVGNDLRVETLNGLMFFTYAAGSETSAQELKLDTERAKTIFSDASAPMKNFLVGFAAQDKNWQAMGTDGYKKELVVGAQGPDAKYFKIESGKITGIDTSVNGNPVAANEVSKYVAVQTGTENGNPVYTVYENTSNKFLEKITAAQSSGVAADQAARMGDFGGAAETALVATSTTYDAVAGRFGMSQQAGTMTIANNGQGSGLWVTPVYKSHESDGFDADGLGYGSDITLYGVALGGDVTLANGVRVGAMFNVGSGDADGQGAASVVSNDFDYFGGSIYAGYAIDNFSIVGDVSYTTIDSDVEANTAAGKTSTSFDTTALSVGVTGQYALKVAEMDVTPHAGMRFTRIDMDDYTIESADFGKVGQYNASSANVFSIPVGVTISKEYVTDTWTVKPSFDLTLTGNFGDDTVDGTVSWTGVSNYDVSTKAEFVDNFTYGAAVGIAAKTGNFGLGLGLNYTGSSNTDEFGVNANARYMF